MSVTIFRGALQPARVGASFTRVKVFGVPARWHILAIALTVLLCPVDSLWGQWTNGSGGAIYYNGGNVGLGSANPNYPLDAVKTSPGAEGIPLVIENQDASTGTATSLGFIAFNSNSLTGKISNVRYAYGAYALTFSNWNGTSNAEHMRIDTNGHVGIGTTAPQYPLSVNGTIQAKEVIVNTGWSDYVFDPTYRLAPLHEIAAYIQDHHHLPDMPSASEVSAKGVDLGATQAKLLAKVEELTLHLIDAETQRKQLEVSVSKLDEQNRLLQKRLETLENRRSGEK